MAGYVGSGASAIKTRVRNAAGTPDTTFLTSDELDECTDAALGRLNELAPRTVYGTLTTVIDQNDYLIASDASGLDNFLGVLDVLWSASGLRYFEIEDVVSQVNVPIAKGIDVFENPSMVEAHFQKWQAYKARLDGTWQLIRKTSPTQGAYIRLSPAPTEVTTVPFVALQARTLANLEAHLEQELVDLAVGRCLRLMARKLTQTKSVSMAGRKTAFGGPELIRESKELIKDAELRLQKSILIAQA